MTRQFAFIAQRGIISPTVCRVGIRDDGPLKVAIKGGLIISQSTTE